MGQTGNNLQGSLTSLAKKRKSVEELNKLPCKRMCSDLQSLLIERNCFTKNAKRTVLKYIKKFIKTYDCDTLP